MSLRLKVLNLALRLVARPRLAATQDEVVARRDFRLASRLFLIPRGTRHRTEPGAPPLTWVNRSEEPPARVILYFHGGAYFAGSPDAYLGLAGRLSALTGWPVAMPAYRLAPEHPAPAAYEDALAAHAALLARGIAPDRIVLGGDSAGGGLAFALLADLCARNLRPAAVFALSPWTDLTLSGESLRRNEAQEVLLPVPRMAEAVGEIAGRLDPGDPRLSPLFAAFDRPPPVLIQAGSGEVLLDDSLRMAGVLRQAGGAVTMQVLPATPHVCQVFEAWLPEARTAVRALADFVQPSGSGDRKPGP